MPPSSATISAHKGRPFEHRRLGGLACHVGGRFCRIATSAWLIHTFEDNKNASLSTHWKSVRSVTVLATSLRYFAVSYARSRFLASIRFARTRYSCQVTSTYHCKLSPSVILQHTLTTLGAYTSTARSSLTYFELKSEKFEPNTRHYITLHRLED